MSVTSPPPQAGPLPLELRALRVEYGSLVAVHDVSLSVERGMILGLLGPNGAGKTSLMSCVAGLTEATYGEVKINGFDLYEQRAQALASLGFQPDVPPMSEGLSVQEFLELFASAYAIRPELRRARVEEVLELVNLTAHRDAMANALSRGMRQRLFLAKTLLPRPPLLILDEPASGLDPLARRELANILRQLSAEGVAVVISSHVLEELNSVCDSLAVMAEGRLLDQGRLAEVRARLNPSPELELKLAEGVSEASAQALKEHFGDQLKALEPLGSPQVGYVAHLKGEALSPQASHDTLTQLINAGFKLTHFVAREANLQELFLALNERAQEEKRVASKTSPRAQEP